MASRFSRVACAVLAVCCTAVPSRAQDRPDRPYRGLFGGGGGAGEWNESLTAQASVGVGADNNLLAVTGIGETPELQLAGNHPQVQTYGFLSAGLSYSVRKGRVGLGASVGTSSQYVPSINTPFVGNHAGSFGVSLQLSRRSQLNATQTVYLRPYNVLVLGPPIGEPLLGQAAPIEAAFGIRRDDHISQSSDISFRRQIGRRSSLDLDYGRTSNGASTSLGGGGLGSQAGSGRFSTGLTRGLGAHAGYTYTEARYPDESPFAIGHNADIGLDFNRALSVSRRTKLSFSTGSSLLKDYQRSYYRLTGNAVVTREIGRSWVANISYYRGVGFVERFRKPFFSDSVTLGMDGLITRRLAFRSYASAMNGDLGLGTEGNAFRSYSGTTGVTMAITRFLALGTDYIYYRYGFARVDGLPTGVARELDRHSGRVYLSMWVPILQRGRRTNASR